MQCSTGKECCEPERARKRKNNSEQQGRRSEFIKIFKGEPRRCSESTRTPGCPTPGVAAPITEGPRPEKKFESRRKTRAPGQEQKGERRNAKRRESRAKGWKRRWKRERKKVKRERERERERDKEEKADLYLIPTASSLDDLTSYSPFFVVPGKSRAGFLNFVTFKFKHSHLLAISAGPVPT